MPDLNRLCMGCMQMLDVPGSVCPHCGWQPGTRNQSHQLMPGSFLAGRYLVGKTLGQGGFGITYVGYDIPTQTKVAIKEFFPGDAVTRWEDRHTVLPVQGGSLETEYQQERDKFLNEAQNLARFGNVPAIVDVKDYFQENGTAYIVMEFIEGYTLKQYLQWLGRPLTLGECLALLEPAVAALEQVHAAQLIHRDISPDNIMIPFGGGLKVLDFGASRGFSLQGERSNTINVKVGFAPEEQYRTHGEQGPWTDVYALAATIYWAITGVIPAQSIDRTLEDHLVKPSAMGVAISPYQETILLRGMAIYARDRYRTLGEFFHALRNAVLSNTSGGTSGGSLWGSSGGSDKLAPISNGMAQLPEAFQKVWRNEDADGRWKNHLYIYGSMLLCMLTLIFGAYMFLNFSLDFIMDDLVEFVPDIAIMICTSLFLSDLIRRVYGKPTILPAKWIPVLMGVILVATVMMMSVSTGTGYVIFSLLALGTALTSYMALKQ